MAFYIVWCSCLQKNRNLNAFNLKKLYMLYFTQRRPGRQRTPLGPASLYHPPLPFSKKNENLMIPFYLPHFCFLAIFDIILYHVLTDFSLSCFNRFKHDSLSCFNRFLYLFQSVFYFCKTTIHRNYYCMVTDDPHSAIAKQTNICSHFSLICQ